MFGKASDNHVLSLVNRTAMAAFVASGVPRSGFMTAF
jgi:hypothetical protein